MLCGWCLRKEKLKKERKRGIALNCVAKTYCYALLMKVMSGILLGAYANVKAFLRVKVTVTL
jgi:hypothetical protein